MVVNLDSRLVALETAQEMVPELFIQDTPGNDLLGPELRDFFGSVDPGVEDFIYVEADGVDSGAFCSENAKWYRDNYLDSLNTGGLTAASGNWRKWYRNSGDLWRITTDSHTNYYGLQCLSSGQGWEWCAEQGIGGQTIIYEPDGTHNPGHEIYNNGTTGTGTLKIRVGENIESVCRFSDSPSI